MRKFINLIFCFLIMSSGCKKQEENPQQIMNEDITSGTWKISQLMVDNNNRTTEFGPYRLTFSTEKDPESPMEIFNKLIVTNGSSQMQGTWIFTHANQEEPYTYYLSVSLVNYESFQSISARWGIKSHVNGKFELHKPAEELSPDNRIMILEKE
jgi:hypothetical protein